MSVNVDDLFNVIKRITPQIDGKTETELKLALNKILNEQNISPNNPFDFYLDGNVAEEGDGTFERPFKTISALITAVLLLDPNKSYVGLVAPCESGYGSEVVGPLAICPTLSLVGLTPQNTGFSNDFLLTSPAIGLVNQYRNVAFNGVFTLDLALATFASLSFQNGAFNINRIDTNASGFVSLTGGIGTTTIGGTVILNGGVMFGDITVNPGATLYCANLLNLGGTFKLNGNCILKTLGMLNPSAGYVDGTIVALNTPTWLTDAASDESFAGSINKTIY